VPEVLPVAAPPVTVSGALDAATARLAAAGCDTPRLDAELLLADVLATTRTSLYLHAPAAVVDAAASARFGALIDRRAAREPVAYILGRKEFRRISLALDRRVLIPRPETELLVELGCSLETGLSVVDVGTGSGAVALALKHERPDLDVHATDISADALAVAHANAARLGLEVRFLEGDLTCDLRCDAVLANLPYVEEGACLAPEISRYEPRVALFAGSDGLDVVRRLVATAGGAAVLALEVGAGQAPAVSQLMRAGGYSSVQPLRDLAGHDRVVVGRR
jgi:release factor glutamine methyltransferase